MTDLKTYVPVKTKEFGELKIEVYYDLGGVNYFTGNTVERGIKVRIHPQTRVDLGNGQFVTQSVIMSGDYGDGYNIHLETLKRRSQNKEQAHFERIKPLAQDIADLFLAGEHGKVFDLVQANEKVEA